MPPATQCITCGSTRLNKLRAELALHFNGLKNIDQPVLWTFREVLVCTDCGEADLNFPPHELQWWEQARAIFVGPIIAHSCRACGSTELRTYGAELALHALGRGNLDKGPLFLFPQVPVCRDCGAARFTIPVSELLPWLNDKGVGQTVG